MPLKGRIPLLLWGVPMSDGMPVIVTITGVIRETPTITTIRFDHRFEAGFGQVVMVWAPGVDEVPMALSSRDAITVQRVGEATGFLTSLKAGDRIGIRGPFGTGFSPAGKTAVIAGGVGAAPLLRIGLEVVDVEFFLGARSADELLFREILSHACPLHIATDDGSAGHRGYVAELLKTTDLSRFDTFCVCGPDLMMKSVLEVLDSASQLGKSQFSMHRYMKCGVGLCGSCCIDPEGLCVCRDGPVFGGDVLKKSELGMYHRDGSGRRA